VSAKWLKREYEGYQAGHPEARSIEAAMYGMVWK